MKVITRALGIVASVFPIVTWAVAEIDRMDDEDSPGGTTRTPEEWLEFTSAAVDRVTNALRTAF